MPLSNTNIEYGDKAWNPIVGCGKSCSYCWARKMNKRFKWIEDWNKPQFFEERLEDPLKYKKPCRILTCFCGDMFSDNVPSIWTKQVLKIISMSQHTHILLTKFPQNLHKFNLNLSNIWIGMTIVNNFDWSRVPYLVTVEAGVRFVSLEPFIVEPPEYLNTYLDIINAFSNLDWIIIGAQTNPFKCVKVGSIFYVIKSAELVKIPIFLKNNLKAVLNKEIIRQYQQYPSTDRRNYDGIKLQS